MSENYLKVIVDLITLSEKKDFKRYLTSDYIKDIVGLFWSMKWDLEDDEYIDQKILPNPHVNNVHYVDWVIKEYLTYHLTKKGVILAFKFKVGGFKSLYPGDVSDLTNQIF